VNIIEEDFTACIHHAAPDKIACKFRDQNCGILSIDPFFPGRGSLVAEPTRNFGFIVLVIGAALGRVDGFGQDEACDERDEGSKVSLCLLAA